MVFEKWSLTIDEEQFQLLAILDVIIGNLDRNLGNILVGENQIVAIDHGLSFPDFPLHPSIWYWDFFEEGKKPLHSAFIELLETFPFEALSQKLKKEMLSLS